MDRVSLGRGADIADRLLELAAAVLRMVRKLPRDGTTRHVVQQLVRAVTAGGANYEEARGAESRADFIHKVGIAMKEVRETIFWLRLLEKMDLRIPLAITTLVRECTELAAIFGASIRTARARASP